MPDTHVLQASAIPYRSSGDTVEVLLITTTRGTRWIFPKGVIEVGQSAAECAVSETEEEAGVTGKVALDCLTIYEYRKWGSVCRVSVYPLEVTHTFDIWPERDQRVRQWVPIDVAHSMLSDEGPREALALFGMRFRP
jgi:phosphohistidine phosphatase